MQQQNIFFIFGHDRDFLLRLNTFSDNLAAVSRVSAEFSVFEDEQADGYGDDAPKDSAEKAELNCSVLQSVALDKNASNCFRRKRQRQDLGNNFVNLAALLDRLESSAQETQEGRHRHHHQICNGETITKRCNHNSQEQGSDAQHEHQQREQKIASDCFGGVGVADDRYAAQEQQRNNARVCKKERQDHFAEMHTRQQRAVPESFLPVA